MKSPRGWGGGTAGSVEGLVEGAERVYFVDIRVYLFIRVTTEILT